MQNLLQEGEGRKRGRGGGRKEKNIG